MIKFIAYKAPKNYEVGRYRIRPGATIIRIYFNDNDVHMSHGKKHLDIFGMKIHEMRRAWEAPQAARRYPPERRRT